MTNKQRLQELLANGTLEILFKLFIEKVGKDALENHAGGYFSVRKIDFGDTVISQRVGKFDSEKKEKYSCLSTEKSLRLKKNIKLGHLTSYQSRNPEGNVCVGKVNRIEQWGHWGGAVLVSEHYILSFSGLPELLDEAFVCFLALKSMLMSREQFTKIKKLRKDNPYLKLI